MSDTLLEEGLKKGNSALNKAKGNKDDEFYTSFEDIDKDLLLNSVLSNKVYYRAKNADKIYRIIFARILIRNKQ